MDDKDSREILAALADLRTEIRTGFAAVNVRLDAMEQRLTSVERRLDDVEGVLEGVEGGLASVKRTMREIGRKLLGPSERREIGLHEQEEHAHPGQ